MVAPSFITGNPILDFLYLLLNGISEVPLISSPLAGVLILIGVLIASRKAAAIMALSSLIGAAVAIVLGAPYGLVTFGLFGYNSVLTGMAFWSGPFTKLNKTTLIISLFGAGITSIVWMVFDHVMGDWFVLGGNGWAIPGFTASFIFTTWVIMLAVKRYGHDIWPRPHYPGREPQLRKLSEGEKVSPFVTASGAGELIPDSENPIQVKIPSFKWTAKEFAIAVLNGVSQVTFVENWKTGILWVIGLTFAFELAPGRLFTNAYTTGWNPYSPLFFAGLMLSCSV